MAGVAARAVNVVGESLVGETNPYLTRQLQRFAREEGRLPENFNEFANASLDSIPRPPPGMKWAIDSRSIEVKAVETR